MPIGTYSGYYTTTITLRSIYNPATVTATGTVKINSGVSGVAGVFGSAGNAVPWTLSNYGTVQSIGNLGLGVSLLSGGSVTNTGTGTIQGSGVGVQIQSAAGTVTNTGTIQGTATDGVRLLLGGLVTNGVPGAFIKGSLNGVEINGTTGSVSNSGSISGGVYLTAGGSVTNASGGAITGSVQGVAVGHASGTIVNSGAIQGTGTNSGGVYLTAGGIVTNRSGGSIQGTTDGIDIGHSSGTVVNQGNVQATGTSGAGINLFVGGYVNNTGVITGSSTGVNISSNSGTVLNFGTITGAGTTTGGSGVLLRAGGSVTNEAEALINGASGNGVSILSVAGTVTNFGVIANSGTLLSGPGLHPVDVFLEQGGTVVNKPGALITSYQLGVYIGGNGGIPHANSSGTVVNYGTITATATGTVAVPAVLLASGGTVTNFGTIASAGDNAVNFKGVAAGTLINFGNITNATPAHATIYSSVGGTIINGSRGAASATISSPRSAISFNDTAGTVISFGTVVNYGTLISTGTTAGSSLYLGQGGVLTNEASGLITADLDAVSIKTVAGTIVNFGAITHTGSGTSGEAVYLGAGGVVTNYGLISGTRPGTSPASYPGAIEAHNQPVTVRNFGTITNPNNSNGVNLLPGGTLINGSASDTSATISAPHGGVYIGGTLGTPTPGAIGTVVNYGTIENSSNAAQAIRLVSGGTVTNLGLLDSGRTGISFGDTAGTIVNFGNIVSTASTSFTSGAGVYLQNGGQITNEVGGSITAERAAVSLGGTSTTAASAIVTNSGVLTGDDGIQIGTNDTGNNTIVNFGTIIGTSGTAIDLGGDGAEVVSEPGSQLNGIIANFKAGDSIDLPGVNAFSLSYVDGVLSLFNQTTPVAQLGVSTPYINPQFSETSDGNGGTMVTVTPPGGPVLFDFVYQYASDADYYYGQVADDGTFGYQIGQQIATPDGRYTILSQEPGAVSAPAGTVFVDYYSHAGIGQASTTPLKSSEGLPDGTGGLGSESDFLVGPGGQTFPFSSMQQVSMPLNTLFGFVFTYADGSSFYSGTVSDDGSFGYGAIAAGSGVLPVSGGSYFIYQEGVTALPAGTVTLNRYFSGQLGQGFAVVAGGGSGGLGSETGVIDVNGGQVSFGDPPEAALPFANPAYLIPGIATADAATAVGEIYQQMLGRAPDSSGLSTYGAMLADGAGIAAVQSAIAYSPETQNDINLAYQQELGRNADSGGLATYEGALAAGYTLGDIRMMLAQSPEAQNDLDQLYRQVLDRDADNGGLNTYASLLAQGGSLGEVRMILAQSGEAQGDINQIYQQVLGRAPDSGGLAAYQGALGSGWSLDGARSDVAHSAEAQADLARLFDGTLGRDPNAAELAGAESRLAQGASLSDLQGDLAGSGSAGGFTAVATPAGNASLSAAPGPTAFQFSDVAFGQDTITGFDPSQDAIVLSHAQAPSVSAVLADASATAAGSLITLNANQSVLLSGIVPTALHPNNFQIV
jgi:hypothetical protein